MKYVSVLALAAAVGAMLTPSMVGAQESWIEGFESDQNIIQYTVENGELASYEFGDAAGEYSLYAEDFDGHQAIWEQVVAVAGEQVATNEITSFRLYTDGVSNYLGWVVQEYDWDTWLISLDVLDVENDPEEFRATLVHEVAHILTLDDSQMEVSGRYYDEQFHDCDTYLNIDGCLAEDSYLHLFIESYWSDLLRVWERIDSYDEDEVYNFYLEYEDQFVNDYAATNPEEDIAESFSYFVLWDYVDSTDIWRQKINFFYDFPELVSRRDVIRSYYDLGADDAPETSDETSTEDSTVSEYSLEDLENLTEEEIEALFTEEELAALFEELFDALEDAFGDFGETYDTNDLDGDGVLTPTTIETEEDVSTTGLIDRLAGQIMLMVDRDGEAWYIDPISRARYYLADGPTAYDFLRAFGLGITTADLSLIPTEEDAVGGGDMAERLAGRILLQVEDNGEAWYVNPSDLKRYYLRDGEAAYQIMRELSLGTEAAWIEGITEGWIQ